MSVIFYTKEDLKKYTQWRWGEEKFGEAVLNASSWEDIKKSNAQYVIIGIPEDVGVRANYGRAGTSKAWDACLSALCNIQNNQYTNPKNTLILGEIDCIEQQEVANGLDQEDPFYPTKIGSLVKEIDDKVTYAIEQLIRMQKTPIIIGGGHNNSYGNIKGTSIALQQPINCINLDAHSDFRPLEQRHSGNGFRYAKEEGYLNKYSMVGLHANYTSTAVFEHMDSQKNTLQYSLFEDYIMGTPFIELLIEAKKFCATKPFGLELDMDAIVGMGSSAISPVGFNLKEARHYLRYFSKLKNCQYIHICEAAPSLELHYNQVGKALAYLVSDVIYAT